MSVNKDDSACKESKSETRLVNPCTITFNVNSTMVDCSNRNITNMQSLDLPFNTTWLDLSNNSISSICYGSFVHLSSLQCLNVSYNKGFQFLDRKAFKGLTSLTTLNMTGMNNPSDVYMINGTFAFLPQLTELIISYWTGHTMAHLKNFQDVICDLKQTNIHEIQADGINTFDTVWVMQDPLFACLRKANLQKLVMRKNYIVSIMPPVLDYLRNLRYLDLSHNIIVGGDHRLLTFNLAMMAELETFIFSYQSYIKFPPNIYPCLGHFNRLSSQDNHQTRSLQKHHRLCTHNISLPPNLKDMDLSHRYSLLNGPILNGICVDGNNSLKNLDLGHNFLEENIFGPVFNFPLLHTLNLHGSRMVFGSYRIFETMNNLRHLIISRCDLQKVIDSSGQTNYETWQSIIKGSNLNSLEHLDMKTNDLNYLPDNVFQNLQYLQFIDLSHNLLSNISFNITHLKNIIELDLSFNHISMLPDNILDLWPDVSFFVNLSHNDFLSQSCNYLSLLSILAKAEKNRNITVGGLNICANWISFATCYKDKLQYCNYKDFVLIAYCLYGIFIVLIAFTSYIFKLKWRFVFAWKYLKLLLNKYQEDNRDLTELKYDAFVCYSHRDYNWVVRILMPMLENNYGYKLCIHERDFEPGTLIDVNIMQSFQESKSVILVITKQSLRSSFLNFELHIAMEQALNIICVFLEKPNSLLTCDQRLPPTLEYFIKTKTYICWPIDENEQCNFWRRLVKALGKPLKDERHPDTSDN